jgi:hypothetical protein
MHFENQMKNDKLDNNKEMHQLIEINHVISQHKLHSLVPSAAAEDDARAKPDGTAAAAA